MKKIAIFTLFLLSLLPAVAQRKASLDTGWKFHRGDVVNAEVAEFDDSKWRTLTVPHDFSMEPAFDPSDERQRLVGWSDMQVGPFSRLSVAAFFCNVTEIVAIFPSSIVTSTVLLIYPSFVKRIS